MAKRGLNIYQRKDKRWEGRYKCGYNADGTPKYRSVYGKSYTAVREALLEKKAEQEKGMIRCNACIGELARLWMSHAKIGVRESTAANYAMKLEKHILPYFSGMKYDMLTAEILNCFIEKKLSEGLSPKYVADIVVVVKSIAKFCAKNYNYANRIEHVSLPKTGKIEKKEMLDKKEQLYLKKILLGEQTPINTGILLAFTTGIRIGELCGLTGADIDLEHGVLSVRRTVQRIHAVSVKDLIPAKVMIQNNSVKKATKVIVGPPKSKSSVRDIPLPDFMLPVLKKLGVSGGDYLLSRSAQPIEPRVLQYRLKKLLQKHGLSQINFHMLRHMFATNCIELGFDVKTLSEILGHNSVEITMNRYVHSSLERKKDCMRLFSKKFSAA